MVKNKSINRLQRDLKNAITARNNCPISKKRTLARLSKIIDDLQIKIHKKANHPALQSFEV